MEKHFAVSGFVTNPDGTKLLMVYHKKLDTWVIPGGHLEPNELPHEGALREIFEETGIKAQIQEAGRLHFSGLHFKNNPKERTLPLPYTILQELIPAKGDVRAHNHIDLIYLCTAEETLPVKQEAEVSSVKWMTWKEVLDSDTFESIKEFVRLHQKGGDMKCENFASS